MQKQDIYDWIARTLEETFEIEASRISLDARLYDDLDIDSIDAVDLIVKLQKHTGKRMQPDAFKSVRTVGDVVDAVHALLQQ
ncbi:acyl carrier protein [Jeongeupia naejangsanensis]|uniref:Acyl carrier protein n=1 Tax=Jeongeupia naejangsanensis TaxID=613195 RepID=A0ABS2BND9_9NEIS|nr:acyl carrier protein [Jeongeupia naejangsanensis]MBM3117136.1 acyl carrier protein [Jeongeupia naejangsanensis]